MSRRNPFLCWLDDGIAISIALLSNLEPVILSKGLEENHEKDGLFLENHSFKLSSKSLKLFLDFLNRSVRQLLCSNLSLLEKVSNLVIYPPHDLRRRIVAVALHDGKHELFLTLIVDSKLSYQTQLTLESLADFWKKVLIFCAFIGR